MFGVRISKLGSASKLGLIAKAIGILRKYGTNAHVYLPGVGTLSGITAGNYLDSAGVTAASVDNPVGLSLDALQAMTLGGELVTNGAFDTDTTGWAAGNSAAIAVNAGRLQITGSGVGNPKATSANFATVVGKTYQVFTQTTLGTNGNAYIRAATSAGTPEGTDASVSSSGPLSKLFVATTTSSQVTVYIDGTAFTGYFDNISVREIPGIHATQATTANKPILRRGLLNLALYARDYTNASWTKRGTTVSASAVLDPDGVAATKLSEAVTTDTHAAQQAFVSAASGYTIASIVKADTRTIGAIRIYDGSAGNATYINLLTGATLTNAAGNTASFVDLGGGWFLHAVSRSLPGSASSFAQVCAIATDNVLSYAGDGTSGILLGRSAIFEGTYTAQQIIDAGGIPLTTSAAASNPSAGKYSWQFDGSNDSLSLSAPLFQMSDDHCVIAGCSPSVLGSILRVVASPSQGAASYTRAGQVAYSGADSAVQASWYDGTNYDNLLYVYPTFTPFVCTAAKRSTTLIQRVNGVQRNTKTATVSFTSTLGSIGAYANAADGHFNGAIYPVIAIKGTVSDSDLLTLERFVGQLSGVSL